MSAENLPPEDAQTGRKKIKNKRKGWQPKAVGYRRFATEAVLRIWQYRMFTGFILSLPVLGLNRLLFLTADSTGTALTSADFRKFLGWRGAAVLVLALLLYSLHLVIEVFAQIYLCDDILNGGRSTSLREIGRGFRALKRFANPVGFLMVLFMLIAAPLTGVGFIVTLTEKFYVPRFITSVIFETPLYMAVYGLIIAGMVFCTAQFAFSVHAVLIDQMKPGQALKTSARLVRTHLREFFTVLLVSSVLFEVLYGAAQFIFMVIPEGYLEETGGTLPAAYTPDLSALLFEGMLSEQESMILAYRIACAFVVILGTYIIYVVETLCRSNIMLQLTRMYYRFTDRPQESFYSCLSAKRFFMYVTEFFVILAGVFLLSLFAGMEFDSLFLKDSEVSITAHRTGGFMASENSLEGIDASVARGVYGSETDIQRTKDGHYIINHDNSFKRLTGVDRKPGDMTLEEIRELRIRDTTGNGNLLPVPTLEELLDRGKGRITLFLELKGVSADRKMADDIVAAVRARDMVEDVVLISLKADAIAYVEHTYPEFETGLLIIGGLGDVSKLECDMVIMEEEMATISTIDDIHEAGKKAGVWTVNTREALYHFLDTDADTIVTDQVIMALEVQDELMDRTDLQVMIDAVPQFLE